jgi:hypothetical protein
MEIELSPQSQIFKPIHLVVICVAGGDRNRNVEVSDVAIDMLKRVMQ